MFSKKSTKDIGQHAETSAKKHLLDSGLRYITKNYRCRKGEIDLIMLDKDQLVFVEVKYRRNQKFGSGFDMVTASKQKKLIETARYYLNQEGLSESISCRFDVVSLEPSYSNKTDNVIETQYTIHWLKNAFYGE